MSAFSEKPVIRAAPSMLSINKRMPRSWNKIVLLADVFFSKALFLLAENLQPMQNFRDEQKQHAVDANTAKHLIPLQFRRAA